MAGHGRPWPARLSTISEIRPNLIFLLDHFVNFSDQILDIFRTKFCNFSGPNIGKKSDQLLEIFRTKFRTYSGPNFGNISDQILKIFRTNIRKYFGPNFGNLSDLLEFSDIRPKTHMKSTNNKSKIDEHIFRNSTKIISDIRPK